MVRMDDALIKPRMNKTKGKLGTKERGKSKWKDIVHVCLSADDNTILGLVALINSIRKNTQNPVFFHILVTKNIKDDLRNWIENSVLSGIKYEIKVFDMRLLGDRVPLMDTPDLHARPMTFARYFYPQYFKNIKGRAVHIDVDVLVQGDIAQLVGIKMAAGTFIAFSDDCNSVSKRFTSHQNNYAAFFNFNKAAVKKLKMKPTSCSFNTGVYVTDFAQWRAHNITDQLLKWMLLNVKGKLYGHEKEGDGSQAPLMIVFYKNYTKLDPLWHVRHLGWRSSKIFSAHFMESAKLLHWSGQFKPWNGVSAYKQLWDAYHVPDPSGKYVPTRRTKNKTKTSKAKP